MVLQFEYGAYLKTHHSVWRFDFDSKKKGHLTPKPISLLNTIIEHCTDEGDVVLDCFGGSGSTAVSAIETNRRYYLIEKEEKYFNICKERIEEANDKLNAGRLPI